MDTRRDAETHQGRRGSGEAPVPAQAALRRAGVPWRLRHGMVRPTLAGWLTALAAALLWLAALTFDARVLVAAAIAWTGVCLMAACGGGIQLLAWRASRTGRGRATPSTPSGRRYRVGRPVQPREVAVSEAYIRLNPDRFAGTAPTGRGWYRRVTVVSSWREPLGLFAVRSVTRDTSELVIVPEPGPVTPTRGDTVSGVRGGGRSAFGFAGLREYEPGDPVRNIAWKRSASAGRLMVKQMPRSTVHAVMLVCDMVSCTTGRQADAVAYEAMSRYALLQAGLEHAGGKLIVTDGRGVATGSSQALRLIASLQGRADDAVTHAGADEDDDIASTVCHAAAAQHMPVSVVVITATPSAGGLVARLHAAGQTDVRVVVVSGRQPDYQLQRRDLDDSRGHEPRDHEPQRHEPQDAHRSGFGRRHPAVRRSAIRPAGSPAAGRPGHPGRAWQAADLTGIIVRIAVTASALELAVQWLTSLVHGEHMWWPLVARIGVAVLAVVPQIPTPARLAHRRVIIAVRGLAFAVGTLIAAIIAAGLRLRDTIGFLPWHPVITQATDRGQDDIRIPAIQAWRQFAGAIASGFRQVYVQLPPLSLTAASDAAIMLAIAVFLLVMRIVLCTPAAVPWTGLVPVVVGAVAYASMLQDASWAAVLALTALLALARWSVHPRAAGIMMPALASALTVALVACCTAPGLRLARSAHLGLDSGGMFSSATVNPMIDLKRSLTAGSSATALTYQSSRARYLRMATLDDFSGGTWSFASSLSGSANLYDAGTSKTTATSKADTAARQLMALSGGSCEAAEPLATYLTYSNGSLDAHLSSDDWLGKHVANTEITIDRLSTRLLPSAGLTLDYSGMNGNWNIDPSCSIYSRTESTRQGDTYKTSGIYLDPITSVLGFQQIDAIRRSVSDLRDTGHLTVPDTATADAARAELVASGAAQRSGDWLFIPVTTTNGILTATHSGSFPGALAYEWSAYGYSDDNTATSDTASTYTLSTSFANAVGYNPNRDSAALASSADWNTRILVMPATVGAVDASDTQAVGNALAATGITVAAVTSVVLDGSLVDGTDPFARVDALDRAVLAQYRSLPSKLPRSVTAVVAQAKADGIPSAGASFDEQEQALQYLVRYFSSNGFTYALDVPGADDGDDSNIAMVGSFLKRRSGYCAHYASAFAVLARALGVPTRMVLGYSTSGVVDENGSYAVSARQLHAWDEAYLSGVGWVPFDVTPAASETSSGAGQSASSAASSSSSPSASSSASGPGSASSSGSASSAASSGASGGPASRAQGRDDASQAGRPARQWVVFLSSVACLGAVCCAPMGIRSYRRRRRLEAFDRAARAGLGGAGLGGDDASVSSTWVAAWRELQDTAWDCGARWDATATDRDIADTVGQALACDAAGVVADRAAACVFGQGDAPAPTMQDAVVVRSAVEGRRRVIPMSLFRRR